MNEQLAMKVMLSKEPPVLTTIGFPPTWVKTQSRAIWPLAAVSKWRGWVLSWDSTVEGSTVVFALFPPVVTTCSSDETPVIIRLEPYLSS